jgi:hypothetical protein
MYLPLLVKLSEVWHRQRGGTSPWWTAEQGSLQPVFIPSLAKRPRDSGRFGSLRIVVDGSGANRATTGDLRRPKPTSNLNLRTSLFLRTDYVPGNIIRAMCPFLLCCPRTPDHSISKYSVAQQGT